MNENKQAAQMSVQELQALGFIKQETIFRETNELNFIRQELNARHSQENGQSKSVAKEKSTA